MIGWLLSPLGRAVAGLAVVGLLLAGTYRAGHSSGVQSVLQRLAAENVEGTKDALEAIGDVERSGASEWLCRTFRGEGCGSP